MLEGKIRKILKYIDDKYPHHPDWKFGYIDIKKIDSCNKFSPKNIDYYDVYIIPIPVPIYIGIIRGFLDTNLKPYIHSVFVMNPINGCDFIRINSKDEKELKILMRPEKIKEIWQEI
jgi:hypothetical protein